MAISNAKSKPWWMPDTQGFLAIAIILGVLGLAYTLLFMRADLNDKVAGAFMTTLGVLTGCLKDVYSYFFGSSKGSEKKDDALIAGAISPTSTPAIVPPAQAIKVDDAPIPNT
jgi:hypothetical protein